MLKQEEKWMRDPSVGRIVEDGGFVLDDKKEEEIAARGVYPGLLGVVRHRLRV